jgi:hypothetical protein
MQRTLGVFSTRSRALGQGVDRPDRHQAIDQGEGGIPIASTQRSLIDTSYIG